MERGHSVRELGVWGMGFVVCGLRVMVRGYCLLSTVYGLLVIVN